MINKLFVYGTLLQGETRNHLLDCWKLIDAFEVDGMLYDTSLGYPAADFLDKSSTIFGELYLYDKDNIESILQIIDLEEGADRNLFKRIILESNGTEFFGYNAGSRLNFPQNAYPRITSGNWRRHGSISSNDICSFALEFEKVQSKRYGVFAEKGHSSFVHIKGNIPILAVACHATAHKREGKLKAQEFYTGAIGVILSSISGVHCLYTTYASEFDSNYCQQTELKEYIREVVKKHKIKFVLDIHGTGSYRKFDIYPGIGKAGEFLNGKNILMNNLERILHKNSIKLGGTDVFPAYRQHTVSRFVNSLLEIPAMQLEINQKYRDPQTDSLSFEKLTNTLADYLASVEKHI